MRAPEDERIPVSPFGCNLVKPCDPLRVRSARFVLAGEPVVYCLPLDSADLCELNFRQAKPGLHVGQLIGKRRQGGSGVMSGAELLPTITEPAIQDSAGSTEQNLGVMTTRRTFSARSAAGRVVF